MKILAIIPARGGSKSILKKNIRLLNGQPMINYTINEAQKSNYISEIVVSTDDKEISKIVSEKGVKVIDRPSNLATDNTPSIPVFRHVLKHLKDNGSPYEKVVILQPTSPLRIVSDIDGAVNKFLNSRCNSVVSVCKVEHPPHWMYFLDDDKLKPFVNGVQYLRRQDAPEIYRLNGAVFVTSYDVIMNNDTLITANTRPFIMPQERSLDIDSEFDLKIADMILKTL